MAGLRPPRGAGEGLLRPTPGPKTLPLDACVLSIVENLEGLDLDGLRRQWRAHLGGRVYFGFSKMHKTARAPKLVNPRSCFL
jgi:hypothetical protein